jgi:peptide deformylase
MERSPAPMEKLRTFGDPVLKSETREVTEFGDDLRRLTDLMFDVMEREDGIGLAANQIGINRKVFVWHNPETEERFVLVNARIVERSDETVTDSEGCLSVPGHSMQVPRHERVVVEGQTVTGQPVTVEASGLLARIFQHEIDHLEGHIILDRAIPEERKRVLKELRERDLES